MTMRSPTASERLGKKKKARPSTAVKICEGCINANTHEGSQRFVDPRTYSATLPPPPPGPPPRASPFKSSWQQISG